MADEVTSDYTQRNSKPYDAYLQRQGTILLPLLIDAIKECNQMLDRLKLEYIREPVAVIVHLMGRHAG